ncbi:large conductance mechanosensitive channel protein MscL [Corynebacterium sphenisci]|uniref:large conductance mechanosensitive channel protein MscL n=1 Tax=Corynebacterium sphenisci TaxID=191493 RepID=UPI0026DF0001|nr:large conductance mechanosensitive channel protein MscL [Corynebacterium sphenisci]MDO5731111.1 large conductance mechanosensitive channel protein MscL [Corynebacterium sphenisci]
MLAGFRNFIMRGNVIDLSVGVVVGSAFTAIVTAFTDNLLEPLIAAIGGEGSIGLGFLLRKGNPETFVNIGAVITAAVNFLLIAAVVYFLIVAPMNKLEQLRRHRLGTAAEEEVTEADLLAEIRDLLAEGAGGAAADGAGDRAE